MILYGEKNQPIVRFSFTVYHQRCITVLNWYGDYLCTANELTEMYKKKEGFGIAL